MKRHIPHLLFVLLCIALLAPSVSATGAPDLVISSLTTNGGEIFAHEPNNVTATVANIGNMDAGAFDLQFAIGGNDTVVAIPGLAVGATTTVEITDPTIRAFGESVTITVTADPNDEVAELNETNNTATVTRTVVYNGYKGKRYTDGDDLTTRVSFAGRYDVVYSAGNTAYNGALWTTQTYGWTAADLPIPAGATVVSARLYQGYTYNKMGVDPAFTLSFNGNTVTPAATYQDIKNFGSYSYPYGMYVYNVTDQFDPAGSSMTITPEAGNNYGLYGAYLVVVYEDAAATEKTILINDEFDMLYARASYAVTSDEATAYAPFANVDTANLQSARAVAVLFSAGDADKSKFFFNAQEYAGFWTDYQTNPQLGFSVYDVTAAVQDGTNEARLQSYDGGANGDNMYAATAILVAEYTGRPKADLIVTGIATNGGEIFAHEPNNVTATVANIGDAPAGAFDVGFLVGNYTALINVTGLAANATTTVEITDPTIRAFGESVTITVTADAGDAVFEANETNNTATVTRTVVYNGYKGKRYTDGDDLTTRVSFAGQYDVVYSAGNTAYNGALWTTQTYGWTAADLPIPAGATVVSARLYQGYTYNKMGVDPAFTLSFNGNTVTPAATYQDIKNFGSYSYPYGMYVYNVTDQFDPAGSSMTITPEAGNNYGLYGAYLVVVYEDAAATEKTILINDEFDMLYARASYAVTSDEATAYAPFANVDTANLQSARAVAVLFSAGDADKSKFFFNAQEYAGFWTDYQTNPQLGFSVYDVTAAVQDGTNEARLQSYDGGANGDNMYAATAILIAEYAAPAPTPVPTAAPSTGGGGNGGNSRFIFDAGAGTILTSSEGKVLREVDIAAADGIAALVIPQNVLALDGEGSPVHEISIEPASSASLPQPANARFAFAGSVYDCSPAGATFDPAIDLVFTLSEEEWNALQNSDLKVQYYNAKTGAWEDVPATVDAATRTVTASVAHFSTFALVAAEAGLANSAPAPTAAAHTPAPATTSSAAGAAEPTQAPGFETVLALAALAAGAAAIARRH
ncbi:DUF3344 domain-containing protein [Methanoculleus sp. FWC-SCC1]|uniref:DUF3344 domain-containing protein n=1 Tax=Methanoculleus frigidifontis TaxID=2584085 RepID=A0ABT8M7Z4_9EURY|nr:DUF3344 domain-containing protein [Methanoculleus sp. FWC-SCC1]MDN7024057.1 DUF3344 domain-containing protein [Methanoculleus sp. FWC-SCC1]